MTRLSTFPKTIEECSTLNISKLKKWGYLNPGNHHGTITWSTNQIKQSEIGISTHISRNDSFIELHYTYDSEEINYSIKLVRVNSNLGKGFYWLFTCPQTDKNCRKLYLHQGYFFHREAFNLYYEQQLQSRKTRELLKIYKKAFIPEEIYEERYGKYFKTHYKGKPTKKFLKLEKMIKRAESYPPDTLERLLLS